MLVKLKYLSCAHGTGRRPTYYFLPRSQNGEDLASPEYVIQTLKKSLDLKEQEEKRLQTQLLGVSADKEAIQRTIAILLGGGSHE